jgi:carbon starvation protein
MRRARRLPTLPLTIQALPPILWQDRFLRGDNMSSSIGRHLAWLGVAIVGAFALATVALGRGESVSALWVVVAAVCCYLIAYRYYSLFLAYRVLGLDAKRQTPAWRHNDGLDYVPTNKYVLYGHHFAAIAGAGPLVGPVLAAQMGYLPGLLWIVAGVVFAGAVQDFVVLFVSTRRDGRSLGDLVKQEMGTVPGIIALFGAFMIMIIILAVLALIVVKALAHSPWGSFTVAATIPVALFMGVYLRHLRPGRIGEVSIIGFVLLMLSIFAGQWVSESPTWGPMFTFEATTLVWMLIAYGFIAASIPVWLLLAPRDYLSTFLKIGTIIALAIGIVIVAPPLEMPAFTKFAEGRRPVWSGNLFPFLFITIACGAVSGFHALISSGTTPKMLENESHARFIGYGGMLAESFVAVMALVAASVHRAGHLLRDERAGGAGRQHADAVAQTLSTWGFVITPDVLVQTGQGRRRDTILARAGGAPTLAVGMAHILHQVVGGKAMMAFWYHFAILFEALFILTAVDAGTRAGRSCCRICWAPSCRPCSAPRTSAPTCSPPPVRRRLGLLPVPGRGRPAGRHQHAVAAVRHRQPDAGRGRAAALHRGAVPHEARALRLGHRPARRLAADLHADRRLAEGVFARREGGLPVQRQPLRRRDRGGQGAGAGQEPRRDVARRLQQPARCRAVPAVHRRGRQRAGLQRAGDAGGAPRQPADDARDAVRTAHGRGRDMSTPLAPPSPARSPARRRRRSPARGRRSWAAPGATSRSRCG